MTEISKVKMEIAQELEEVSFSYLKIGLDTYYENKKGNKKGLTQAIVGNLCISVELMIKAAIAKEHLPFLYTNLTKDIELAMIYDSKYQMKNKKRLLDLRYFNRFKNLEFNSSIALFYQLYPECKSKFKSYLDMISTIRNNSVHALINVNEKFMIERVVYISLSIFDFLVTKEMFWAANEFIINNSFLDKFDEKRNTRVKREFEEAKKNLEKISEENNKSYDVNWDSYITDCPICKSKALMDGYCEFEAEKNEGDNTFSLSLYFISETFKCEHCGLHLLDYREIELAGIKTEYDRYDEIDDWLLDEEAKKNDYNLFDDYLE